MLKYELIKNQDDRYYYKYYPEGRSAYGIVSIDNQSSECRIEDLAEKDEYRVYALRLMSRLRRFWKAQVFQNQGIVAWY